MTSTISLTMNEIGKGVAEVYDGTYQVGLITWSPNPVSGIVSTWYATYANGDETVTCMSRDEALEILRLQHAAVRRFSRSLRSIRPAGQEGRERDITVDWDRGYNTALRDVERLLQEVVGVAPDGEGFTAITREER